MGEWRERTATVAVTTIDLVRRAAVREVHAGRRRRGSARPGYESCTLFLVPEGKEPERISFLPYDPENPTEFVYWNVE